MSPGMQRRNRSRPRSVYSDALHRSIDSTQETSFRHSSLLRNHENASYSPTVPEPVTPERPEHVRSIEQLVESEKKRRRIAPPSDMGPNDDAASTVSSAAPSTVWDELDDLKSRIRRLELTGKMPASGSGNRGDGQGGPMSNSSGERPRTANTTMTTLSSSPRNKGSHHAGNGISPSRQPPIPTLNLTPSAPNPPGHPLLQTALNKAADAMSPESHKYLQTVVNEALTLAAFVGSTGQPGSLPPGSTSSPATDRQVRRKVDSLCRSLTEFCVAMADDKAPSAAAAVADGSPARPLQSSRPSTRIDNVDSPRLPMRTDSSMSAHHKTSLSSLSARRGSNFTVNTRTGGPTTGSMSEFAPSPTAAMPPTTRLGARTSLLKRDSIRVPSRATSEFYPEDMASPASSNQTVTASEQLAMRRAERREREEARMEESRLRSREIEREREREREREIMTLSSSPPRPTEEGTARRRMLDISGRGLVGGLGVGVGVGRSDSRLRSGSLTASLSTRRRIGTGTRWDEE